MTTTTITPTLGVVETMTATTITPTLGVVESRLSHPVESRPPSTYCATITRVVTPTRRLAMTTTPWTTTVVVEEVRQADDLLVRLLPLLLLPRTEMETRHDLCPPSSLPLHTRIAITPCYDS